MSGGCPCSCHNGLYYSCDVSGGCGSVYHKEKKPQKTHTKTEKVCVVCAGSVQDGYLACSRCGDKLAHQLSDVPSICEELETTITRQDNLAGAYIERPGAERALPWNETAAEAQWILENTLTTWARDLSETRKDDLDATTAPSVALWLKSRVDWLRSHNAAEDIYDELTSAIRGARKAVDRPGNRARFKVGPCPERLEDGSACPGEVWAFIPTRDDQMAMMRCGRECGGEWNTTQWLRVGTRIRNLIEQRKKRVA